MDRNIMSAEKHLCSLLCSASERFKYEELPQELVRTGEASWTRGEIPTSPVVLDITAFELLLSDFSE